MSATHNSCWPKRNREGKSKHALRCLSTARLIMDLRCVTTVNGRPMYQRFGHHLKVCQSCYLTMPINLQQQHVAVAPHLLIHMNFLHDLDKCPCCRKVMVKYNEAEECQNCLDAFEHADKIRLKLGWGYPCIKPNKHRRFSQSTEV